jgi:hypothetical protein
MHPRAHRIPPPPRKPGSGSAADDDAESVAVSEDALVSPVLGSKARTKLRHGAGAADGDFSPGGVVATDDAAELRMAELLQMVARGHLSRRSALLTGSGVPTAGTGGAARAGGGPGGSPGGGGGGDRASLVLSPDGSKKTESFGSTINFELASLFEGPLVPGPRVLAADPAVGDEVQWTPSEDDLRSTSSIQQNNGNLRNVASSQSLKRSTAA